MDVSEFEAVDEQIELDDDYYYVHLFVVDDNIAMVDDMECIRYYYCCLTLIVDEGDEGDVDVADNAQYGHLYESIVKSLSYLLRLKKAGCV